MMLILIILGFFMDWVGILLLTMPIFVPIIKELGYDPVWFGILFCMNMQISLSFAAFWSGGFLSQRRCAARNQRLLTSIKRYGSYIVADACYSDCNRIPRCCALVASVLTPARLDFFEIKLNFERIRGY